MTVHSHQMETPTQSRSTPAERPRWLVPILVGVPLVGALLAFSVVSPATLLYVALFGGMMLICMGGHGGHGGHDGDNADMGHAGHRGPSNGPDLSSHSSHAQPADGGSTTPLSERASGTPTSETGNDDQHSSHGCH